MTDNIPALIAEARDWASKAVLVGRNVIRDLDRGVANTRRLADALEATAAERDRYRDLARRSELQCQDAEKDCGSLPGRARGGVGRGRAVHRIWHADVAHPLPRPERERGRVMGAQTQREPGSSYRPEDYQAHFSGLLPVADPTLADGWAHRKTGPYREEHE